MSEYVRVVLMLARNDEESEPCVVGAVDQVVWEHWDDADEMRWQDHRCRESWGLGSADFREVWIRIPSRELRRVYDLDDIEARVDQ